MQSKMTNLIGCATLSIWCGLNVVASLVAIIFPVVFKKETARTLIEGVPEHELAAVHEQIITNGNAIAVFANGLNVSLCSLLLFLVWGFVYLQRSRKAWWLTFGATLGILITGILAGYVAGFPHPEVSWASGIILGFGLIFSGHGCFAQSSFDTFNPRKEH